MKITHPNTREHLRLDRNKINYFFVMLLNSVYFSVNMYSEVFTRNKSSSSVTFTSLINASVNEMLAVDRSLGVVNRTVLEDLNYLLK